MGEAVRHHVGNAVLIVVAVVAALVTLAGLSSANSDGEPQSSWPPRIVLTQAVDPADPDAGKSHDCRDRLSSRDASF